MALTVLYYVLIMIVSAVGFVSVLYYLQEKEYNKVNAVHLQAFQADWRNLE